MAELEVKEQCKKCFHFQVCANVLKQQLYIREVMLKEENPKCDNFVPAADVVEVNELTPCDVCAFNPPSCMDGKPCTLCPAQAKKGW